MSRLFHFAVTVAMAAVAVVFGVAVVALMYLGFMEIFLVVRTPHV